MMSMITRRALAVSVSSHYKDASKSRKSQILDEFVLATGYNRKYAIWVLVSWAVSPAVHRSKPPSVRTRRRKYGPDVATPLLWIWRVAGCLCPKRLMPFLLSLIEALERFDEIRLSASVRAKLLTMSVSTAARLICQARRSASHGISTTRAGTLLRNQIPIRTYEDWSEGRAGLFEVDLVAHCGGSAAGDYCYTLTMTDIFTGWTECYCLINRSQITVRTAIEQVRKRLPFALLGIDSDNGSEFINYLLMDYCDREQITFTRCRPYKKNDQCHVEQKNGAVVRPLVGYARYEGAAACEHLNKLYFVHRLCMNYFEPSMKLIGKNRVGARVKKMYDTAKTPWQRLEVAEVLSKQAAAAMKQRYEKLNPVELRHRLQELEMGLSRFAVGSQLPDPLTETTCNVTIEGGDTNEQNA